MKKIILGISILGMSFGMQAQVENIAIGIGGTTTASNFHYNTTTKRVGIGVTNPNHNLTVYDPDGSGSIEVQASFGIGNIFFSDDYYGSFANTIRSEFSTLSFGKASDVTTESGGTFSSHMNINTSTGNILIGEPNVSNTAAHLNHKLTVYNSQNANMVFQTSFGKGNILFSDDYYGTHANMLRSQNSTLSFGRGSDINNASGGTFTSHMAIDTSTGKVGIGTTTTGSHKLAVEGSIGAREVKVELGTWSDFVFEKTYNLPSLKEVEEHILKNGHLENIPSKEDVLENGIYLGDMNAKLLQKIEELTLYTIDQEKQLKAQDTTINTLASKLLELQLEIEKLKE